METSATVFFIILVTFAVGVRFLWLYEFHIRKSYFTSCPNCNKTKRRVKKGKYKCENCGFIFEVDARGNSIKNSLWGSIIVIGFGVFFLIQIVRYFFREETEIEKALRTFNPPSVFEQILYPSLYGIMMILAFYFGIAEIRGYLKDKKQSKARRISDRGEGS